MLLPVTDVLQLTHSRTLPDGNVGAVVSTRHRTLWWCERGQGSHRQTQGGVPTLRPHHAAEALRAAWRLCVHITRPDHVPRKIIEPPRDTWAHSAAIAEDHTPHVGRVQRVYDARCLFQHCASHPPLHLQTNARLPCAQLAPPGTRMLSVARTQL